MTTTSRTNVEERLTRLEKENRALKLVGLAVVLGFGGLVIGGAQGPQIANEIATRKLLIVGPDNDARVVLGFDQRSSAAGLTVYQKDQRDGRGLVVQIGCDKDGNGEIRVLDRQGRDTFSAPRQSRENRQND